MATYVSDSNRDLTERLFARSFRLAVASCLRWADLISTAPSTSVLMKEGLIGFAAKTKTGGKSDGRPLGGGGSHYAISNEKWLRDGFEFPQTEFGS